MYRHEHLYEKIEENVIRSDDFPHSVVAAERQLRGSRVILCTLSMLSNDRISPFTRTVPPTLLIFDEASQIEVGDYIPMLHLYRETIRKLVFIGDDKQRMFISGLVVCTVLISRQFRPTAKTI